MDKYIIKANGNMQDVIRALKTLQLTFGKGAPLSHVEKVLQGKKTLLEQVNELWQEMNK